jgi:hypothetical protein
VPLFQYNIHNLHKYSAVSYYNLQLWGKIAHRKDGNKCIELCIRADKNHIFHSICETLLQWFQLIAERSSCKTLVLVICIQTSASPTDHQQHPKITSTAVSSLYQLPLQLCTSYMARNLEGGLELGSHVFLKQEQVSLRLLRCLLLA